MKKISRITVIFVALVAVLFGVILISKPNAQESFVGEEVSFDEAFEFQRGIYVDSENSIKFDVRFDKTGCYFYNSSNEMIGGISVSEADMERFLQVSNETLQIPETPERSSKNFDIAKKAVISYVEKENRFSDEEKEICKRALEEATLYNGVDVEWYAENLGHLGAYTYEGNVYLLDDIADDPYVLVHECVHVIAGAVRKDKGYCQQGLIEEAITETIAQAICDSEGIYSSAMEMTSYKSIVSMAYALSTRYDVIDAYFHGFDSIKNDIGEDKLKAIVISLYAAAGGNWNSYELLIANIVSA